MANSRKSWSFRRVVIPQGSTSHVYLVDGKLDRLVNSGSLRSNFLLTYLHAPISPRLPDPLTGRTGTEEGLRILRSATAVSFERHDGDCSNLLRVIAGVSPVRNYYPRHLICMKEAERPAQFSWLSQHDFYGAIQAIRAHARDYKVFFHCEPITADPIQGIKGSMDALFRRAMIRNSTF